MSFWNRLSEKNKRIIMYVGGASLLSIFLRIVFPLGSIHIEVAAEEIAPGFTNSMLVTIFVDLLLILLAIFGTLQMKLVPRGVQNIAEYIVESLYNLFKGINAEHVARVFPIIATIFLFVLTSNLLGLFPGFGSIGLCAPRTASKSTTRPAHPNQPPHPIMAVATAALAPANAWPLKFPIR